MCGFAGVIAFDEPFTTSAEALARMAGCVAHRGPDGRGVYRDEHEATRERPQAALAHVRLAILDPDPRSDQPFEVAGKWLVYNGEVYNFRELREELRRERPGYEWRTTGDTEVLAVAYDVWGEGCLARLDGMFAFAVWDAEAREVFLARDRMGQKPLYYAVAPGGGAVAFASELAAVRSLAWVDAEVDPVALAQYLSWGYVPAPWTIYRGARKLGHARWMRLGAGGKLEEGRYFDVNAGKPEAKSRKSDGEVVAATRRAVLEGVRRQLVADVPVGCFLSGGVDSSIVAAGMVTAAGAGQRVMTFSIGFEDARYDETGYARGVARHLGTDHHEFRVRPDAAADLPKLAAVYGEPFGDSSALPTHYLARETRRHVKVALSGDGGDELFGGYDRYRAMRLGEKLRGAAGAVRGVAGLVPGVHPRSMGARLKRFAATLGLLPADRYASYMRLFTSGDLEVMADTAGDGAAHWFRQEFVRLSEGRDVVETALAVDRETYLPEDLFTKVDRASMLHALEVRSPFMDPDVLRLAAGLTTDQLLGGGGKRMLREAFAADLPPAVFRRRKMGFAVPIGEWFRSSLRDLLHDALFSAGSFATVHLNAGAVRRLADGHDRRAEDHTQRLYVLLMLELWWRQQRQI